VPHVATGIEGAQQLRGWISLVRLPRWIMNLPHAKVSGGVERVVQLPREQPRPRR
jgi:hypothetical protein